MHQNENPSGAVAAPQAAVENPYKAELDRVKAEKELKEKELKQAQFTIVKLKQGNESRTTNQETVGEGGSQETTTSPNKEGSLDAEKLKQEIIEQNNKSMQQFFAAQSADIIEEQLAAIPDEHERNLTRFHFENSVVKTGFDKSSISAAIQNARVLANRPKIETQLKEVTQAALSKAGRVTATTSGQEGSVSTGSTEQKFSADEEKWISEATKYTGLSREKVVAQLLKNRGK